MNTQILHCTTVCNLITQCVDMTRRLKYRINMYIIYSYITNNSIRDERISQDQWDPMNSKSSQKAFEIYTFRLVTVRVLIHIYYLGIYCVTKIL